MALPLVWIPRLALTAARGVLDLTTQKHPALGKLWRFPDELDLDFQTHSLYDSDGQPLRRRVLPIWDDLPGSDEPVPVIGPKGFRLRPSKDVPRLLPSTTLRPTRSKVRRAVHGAPLEVHIRPPSLVNPGLGSLRIRRRRDDRDEENRRRRDQKLDKGYARILHFVNRTYGAYTEWMEVADAFKNNPTDPAAIFTALAINSAIDTAYGARAGALRQYVYSNPRYKLPVGLDFLASPFRRGGPWFF